MTLSPTNTFSILKITFLPHTWYSLILNPLLSSHIKVNGHFLKSNHKKAQIMKTFFWSLTLFLFLKGILFKKLSITLNKFLLANIINFYLPDGWVFLSKKLFRTSSACGVNEVRRLRFLDGSLPIKSVRFWIPFLYLSSASCIQRSNTGLIFWALFGVMSNFSNLKVVEDRVRHQWYIKNPNRTSVY